MNFMIGLRWFGVRLLFSLLTLLQGSFSAAAQSASTGALTGIVVDATGARIADASVEAKNEALAVVRSTSSDLQGRFVLPFLPPGDYAVTAHRTGFAQEQPVPVAVPVAESVQLLIAMKVAGVTQQIEVHAHASALETDIALGRLIDGRSIENLPLVTRNFTQIVDLSPGVQSGVHNAGELGRGGSGLAQIDPSNDGIFAHGARSYDNAYEFDGVPVTDLQASGIASGGIPIPNPDAISEFKVQTGLYDVSFGEHGGANVSLITKSGTSRLHGSAFEFFRNEALNANDFFFSRAGERRPLLRQNQFGLTVGGPIRRDRLFYFGSYQGTRQTNGLASGQARISCSATVVLPPLTNDRSAEALGTMFAGMTGQLGGTAIKPDGSNINPVAIELLNFKLPGGAYLIPTPEVIDQSLPLASQGQSTLSDPCRFNEDQVLANLDANMPGNARLSFRGLWSNGDMNVSFPGNGLNGTGNVGGFSSPIGNDFRVFSVSYVRVVKPKLLNDAKFGYTRTVGSTTSQGAFQWSDVGVAAGSMNNENGLPSLGIAGSVNLASAFPRTFDQERFFLSDALNYSRSRHQLRFGGSLSRIHDDLNIVGVGSLVDFLSWPDFLLGLSSDENGTNLFSNVFASIDDYGLLNREYRSWNGSLYIGDHYQAADALTLDAGLRYERISEFNDELGRNSSFDINRADPNPAPSGSVAGYIVAANYKGPTPTGVIRAHNDAAILEGARNGLAPRIGVAWQPSGRSSNVVIRAGYGIFFSQPTGQAFFQSVFGAPFSLGRVSIGQANSAATFSHPFPEPFPTPEFFPYFPAYSPTSNVTITTASPEFRPAILQQFGLSWQWEFTKDCVLEIGYAGTRGTHLLRSRSVNQALAASADTAIRGVTANTIANIGLRVPVQGVPPDSLWVIESAGTSWYNGLEASLTRQLGRGLQFLSSYTFSKILDSDGSNTNGISAGNTIPLGDQNSPRQRWGRASFDRTHRFVMSAVYVFPAPLHHWMKTAFAGWAASGVLTLQSGTALTIAYTNPTNVFGISEDRAQLSPKCNGSNLVRRGSIETNLGSYFNSACFTTPPVVGADGVGTNFGDSSTGIANGPGQSNLDVGLVRNVDVRWPREGSTLQLRAEFFNVLNHPQFSNPNASYATSTFGVISSTSVNPRVGQVALKMIF
jgi:hypothetical protein